MQHLQDAAAARAGSVVTHRESGQPAENRRFADPSSDSPTTPSPNPAINNFVDRVREQRRILIGALKTAATPETKDLTSKELKKALGGSEDGTTVRPDELNRLVEALKTAADTTAKDSAAKALENFISPDGQGKELTPTLLHNEVEEMKKAAGAESREKEAKDVLKTMGPDGVQMVRKKARTDGKSFQETMATVLGLDKDRDRDALAALENGARDPQALAPAPIAGTGGSNAPIPLSPGPVLDGNPPPVPGLTDPNVDPNKALNDAINDPGGVFNPGDVNKDDLAQQDLNDLQDQLKDINDLKNQLDRDRENKNKNEKNAGDKNINKEAPPPTTPPTIPPVSVGERAKNEPIPPPKIDSPKELPAFQAPPPPPVAGMDPALLKALLGGDKDGDGKWQPGVDKLAEMLSLNLQTQLALIKANGDQMLAMIERSAQARAAKSAAKPFNAVGKRLNVASAKLRRNGGKMSPRRPNPRLQKKGTGLAKTSSSGPSLGGRSPTSPQSLRGTLRGAGRSVRR